MTVRPRVAMSRKKGAAPTLENSFQIIFFYKGKTISDLQTVSIVERHLVELSMFFFSYY